ncbi:MAG TPA: NepR family anti-sigma factor [Hyphomicrobiales bacterium]|nr:NepR family anti-sigma factor [Hyphomicrobiales bacterium]
MDPELQAHIGRHLKAAYEDILNQPVPDRFRQLLDQLSESEGSSSEESNGGKVFGS